MAAAYRWDLWPIARALVRLDSLGREERSARRSTREFRDPRTTRCARISQPSSDMERATMKTDASVTVYIVDDEPDVCRGLERLLRTASYETRSFLSGPEFLAAHDPDQPGCVILDFDLAAPGLDGLKVQSMLAASGCLRPIIFLTGRANIATSVAAL